MRDLLFAVINLTNCILFLNNIINFNNFLCISCTIFVWQNFFITKNNQQLLGDVNMDVNEVISLIDSVGFPITMCLLMGFFLYKYIVPLINESIAANREIITNLTLMNERIGSIERDMDNVKTKVKNIKKVLNYKKKKKNKG